MPIAYPKRNDSVVYMEFDGTLKSVRELANFTNRTANIRIEANPFAFSSDPIHRFELGNQTVENGAFVVRTFEGEGEDSREIFRVLSRTEFAKQYSKDGN